jgi:uracil-DNA glycosylase
MRTKPERSQGPAIAAVRAAPDRTAEWERLVREIQTCRRCPLGATRIQAVVYRGGLAPRVVFIGEAPGAAEDREGLPFVGRSGRRLDAAIESVGLRPEEFGVLNVLKCHPPANRFDRNAARTCRPFLDRQLGLLRPRLLVTLGASALQAMEPTAPPILTVAGAPRLGGALPLFPLIHPAAALRSRRLAERWTRDVDALRGWLHAVDKPL